MSFAKIVKEELCQGSYSKEEQLAELAALLLLNSELSILSQQKTLWFKTNNPTIARRFLLLIKSLYSISQTLLTKQQTNLNKYHQIQIGVTQDLDRILSEHDIITNEKNVELLTQSDQTKKAFLRGAFLASGSVNDPKTAEYHLEIYASNPNHIIYLQKIMNGFDLNAKITTRRKGYIAYLKDAEHIEDFLRHIGAWQTVFTYEDIRIKRDFNNSINRIMNCELANEKKAVSAALVQIDDINLVLHHQTLNDKLKKIADLRLNNPEASLKELVDLYIQTYQESITKSGINHRLTRIKQIADQIKESKDKN